MKTLGFAASVVLLCLLTVVMLVVGNGNVALAVAPTLLLAVMYAIWKLPLRYPLLILTFLALTLENPSDSPACDLWKSPLYPVGAVLLAHLNVTFPQKWMLFSGLDLVLVYLLAVALYRWSVGSKIDKGRVGVARPMRLFVLLVPVAAVGMWLWGLARGGANFDSSLWQMQRIVYLPVVFLLFAIALRGARDRAALAKVFILAACIRAALAIYIRDTVVPPAGHKALEYATTHPDSMLFAGAVCLVAALLFERFDRKRILFALLVLPLLVAGMIANTRRIVWVELAVGLFALYMLTPWRTRVRRTITRAVIIASPVALIYIAIGWSASSEKFAPVEIARSVVDSSANRSTEWRDWENYDLVYTLRQNPIIGSGYGHGYIELWKLPSIKDVYKLYRFAPHNSILGLWAYGGIVGFAALWTVYSVAIFFAARIYRRARGPTDRIAALASTGYIVVYLAHCYGDMGLGTWTSVFTVGPVLAVIGQLAVATGVWRERSKPQKPDDQAPPEYKHVEVLSVERVTDRKKGAAAA